MTNRYETIVPDQYRFMVCYASVVRSGVYDLRRVDASTLIAYWAGESAIDLLSTFGDVLGRINANGVFSPAWIMHESVRCSAADTTRDAIVNGNVSESFDIDAQVNR